MKSYKNNPFDDASIQIPDAISPRYEVKPSNDLRDRILQAAAQQGVAAPKSRTTTHLWRWGSAVLSAAAVVLLAVVISGQAPVYAARKYLEGAVQAMSDLRSLHMELRIRTVGHESFEYTDPRADFIRHNVVVSYGEPTVWRIEKSDRKILWNGLKSYQWIPTLRSGWVSDVELADGFVEYLINPTRLLEGEILVARHTKGADYELTELPDGICLVVTMPAQGDFAASDYMLNTSLLETNTRRTYHFDKQSGRLRYAHIEGLFPEGERTLLETELIRYDVPVDTALLTALPDEIEWSELAAPEGNGLLCGIEPEEAARRIFTAMHDWDEELLDVALHFYKGEAWKVVKRHYKRVELLHVGKAFRSGAYVGWFVPCRVRKADGSIEELNLALRNDNRDTIWLVDGGL